MVYEITDWIPDDELDIPTFGPLKLEYRWLDLPEFARFETRMDALQKPAPGEAEALPGEIPERDKRNEAWITEALAKYVRIAPGQLRDRAASEREGHDVWLTEGTALLRVFPGNPALIAFILTRVRVVNQVSASERGNSLRRLDSVFFSAEPPTDPNGAEPPIVQAAEPPASVPSEPASDLRVSASSGMTAPSSSASVLDDSSDRGSAGPLPGLTAPMPSSTSAALEVSTIG